MLSASGLSGASIESVTAASASTYVVRVNTGTGTGTLRLDVVDDDSIADSAGNLLGGPGAANGSFGGGETYSIEKNRTTVLSIMRADTNPNSSASVRFDVTFSGAVSGVDAADFVVAQTGGVRGASVASVTGSGATYMVTVNTGTGDGGARLDLVDNDSVLDSTNQPLGGAGAGNGSFTTGETYTINKSAPSALSIVRLDADPSTSSSVRFTVNFSEAVTGVDASDFSLTVTGLTGASVASIAGSGSAYTVTVNTGAGNGTLRLDLVDNDSVVDSAGTSLGGAGTGNGSFTAGQIYTVNKNVTMLTATYTSNGTADGWVLESGEDTNKGGSVNGGASTINLGDDASDRQYRAILHFPTSGLPDNAVITMAILSLKLQGVSGTSPFNTHQNINVDIKSGYFGSAGLFGISSLDLTDFQSDPSKLSAGAIYNSPVGGWYWSSIDPAAFRYVNLTGVTQFRLHFQLDDNDDRGSDYLRFFSGNASLTADRPQLQVKYYVPK